VKGTSYSSSKKDKVVLSKREVLYGLLSAPSSKDTGKSMRRIPQKRNSYPTENPNRKKYLGGCGVLLMGAKYMRVSPIVQRAASNQSQLQR